MTKFAGFWQRVQAFLWDYLIIACYLMIISILAWLTHVNNWLFINRIQSQLSAFVLITLPVILYFSILESSKRQGTWGKHKMKLRVIDQDESRISFTRALVRTFLKFIPWELSHTLIWEINFSPETNSVFINVGFAVVYLLIGLNIASLLLTKTRQTMYDLLTKTFVEKYEVSS
jgi:uncharacterized RDD family membrane protein YckC